MRSARTFLARRGARSELRRSPAIYALLKRPLTSSLDSTDTGILAVRAAHHPEPGSAHLLPQCHLVRPPSLPAQTALNEANGDTEVSDGEMDSDGPDEVPSRAPIPSKATEEEVEDDDDDDDDEEGEEYRVEKVLGHKFVGKKNEILYEIKWLGYEKKSDHTWEPIENLSASSGS